MHAYMYVCSNVCLCMCEDVRLTLEAFSINLHIIHWDSVCVRVRVRVCEHGMKISAPDS